MSLRTLDTIDKRLAYIQNETGSTITHIPAVLVDKQEDIHCENTIGAISIPIGVAGPISIHEEKWSGSRFIPLATTEGALVASVSRGCKAISESGGAITAQHTAGTTRGPVFYAGGITEQRRLTRWISNNHSLLQKTAESTSSHLKLTGITVKASSQYVFVRFSYDTSEAMGMNMVTIATQNAVDLITEHTGVRCLAVAGNFDIDKKPAWLNIIEGRGREVWAEAVITEEILKKVLKTTATDIYEVWLGKCVYGSYLAGSLGYNCHFANIVAAFFAATGQDLAHVVEGSNGITSARVYGKDLSISVYLPSLMLGSIGGGTRLKTQSEARSITGCSTTAELAELLASAVLAGELSLLASLSVHSLAGAHKRLGR